MVLLSRDILWQEVHWPIPLDSGIALALLQRLASDASRQSVIWEARCIEGAITHLVGTAIYQAREITSIITSLVPGATVSPTVVDRSPLSPSARLRIKPRHLLLDTKKQARAARTLLGGLTEAHFRGEEAALQVILGPGISPQSVGLSPADPTQSLLGAIALGTRPASPELVRQMRDKRAEAGFRATVRMAALASSEQRRVAILRGLLAGVRTLQSPGTRIDLRAEPAGRLDAATESTWTSLSLNSSEVLSLLAWPLDVENLPGIPATHPRLLPLSASLSEKTRPFATTNAPGTERPLGANINDALFHTIALGPTGSGKSTALLNLILADLSANRGLVVIDPKADLVHDVLERVPPDRHDDVIVLDPTQVTPVGLNPLFVPGSSPELIADGILAVFRDLFPSAFGPRVDDVTHASLLTLAHHPGATLTWLPRLLSDASFRASLIGGLNDPDGLGSFWVEYNALSDRQQTQFMGPVLSRLRQFLLRPNLRRVLDQSEPRFALEDIFTKNKILLVPLNAGLLGNDAARLLGSLLVGQLWQHTLARAAKPIAERTPVSLYIDEMQEFIRLGGDNLSDALARSRSLGVAWHLAHQYRDQLPAEMRSAIDANARNKIVFGLGVKDAKDMAAMAPELTPEDFMSLPQHSIYANLMHDGQQTGWVSGRTLPPPQVVSDPIGLLAASQRRYGRAPVEAETVSAVMAPPRPDGTIGRRKRSTS